MSRPGSDAAPTRATRLLWFLVLPRRARRFRPTVAGWGVLVTVLGLGAAAYNNASNILFLALALLVATLLVGGVLAGLNLRRLEAEWLTPPHLTAGEPTTVRLRVRNLRRRLPAYAIRADVRTSQHSRAEELHRFDPMAPGEALDYPWIVTPVRRGLLTLRLETLRSAHPFGLLDIAFGRERLVRLPVRPAPVPYTFLPYETRRGRDRGASRRREAGGDTVYLRAYREGDSPRIIHWRASAKRGALLVREMETARDLAFGLRLDPACFGPGHEAAFEKACALALALAEDLWRQGRLAHVALGDESPRRLHKPADLDAFLDALATVRLDGAARPAGESRDDTLTLHPGPGDIVHVRLQNRQVGEA